MDTTPQTLADAIDAFIERHQMSPITFGRKAMNDPHFVRDVKAGRDLKLSTVEKVRSFMADYVPEPAHADAPVEQAA